MSQYPVCCVPGDLNLCGSLAAVNSPFGAPQDRRGMGILDDTQATAVDGEIDLGTILALRLVAGDSELNRHFRLMC